MGTLSAEKQRKEIELADYTEMENRLIGLENHNKEDGLLLMNQWIDSMGLRFSEAPEWGEEVYDLLSGKKGVGFSGKNADRLINAIKDLKTAQNYLPALYLMNDINNAMVGQLGDITKLYPAVPVFPTFNSCNVAFGISCSVKNINAFPEIGIPFTLSHLTIPASGIKS